MPFSPEKHGLSDSGSAESAAFSPENIPIDPDLQAIIDAWPTLADDVKAAIMAMVR